MRKFRTDPVRQPKDYDDAVYPCSHCGVLRSERQGAKIFIVCDACWDKWEICAKAAIGKGTA